MKSLLNKNYPILLLIMFVFVGCSDKDPDFIVSRFFGNGNSSPNQIKGKNIIFSKFAITYDNNRDGIIDKGETVYLRVYLKNTGSSQANSVQAKFSTTSSYISGLSPTSNIDYGNLSAGSENYGSTDYDPGYSYYTIKFTVSNTTPANSNISFSINIQDAETNTWNQNFNVNVQ